MLPLITVLCVVVATFFWVRYYAVKTRLAEGRIDKLIANKLARTEYARTVALLREENGVMRNLLIDIVENNSNQGLVASASSADKARFEADRTKRNREILSEAAFVVRNSVGSATAIGSQLIGR